MRKNVSFRRVKAGRAADKNYVPEKNRKIFCHLQVDRKKMVRECRVMIMKKV
jgi:hypothetical protein